MNKNFGHMTFSAGALCAALAIGGCSRSIPYVKDSDAPDARFKIGQVLDHKDNCTSSSWSHGTDENGRPVVTFRCEMQIPDDALASLKAPLLANERQQFDTRIKGGPYLIDHGFPLSQELHDSDFDDPNIRRDPEAAVQLDQARVEYAKIVEDLAKVDAKCAGALPGMQADLEARVDKYFAGHRKIDELIQFVLKDDTIVEQQLSAKFEDGSDALSLGMAPLLYRFMLSPSDRNAEYGLLTSSLMKRVDVGDIKYCGDSAPYQPFTARTNAVFDETVSAQQLYADHLARHQSGS